MCPSATETSINRVLQAEQDCRQRLETCRAEADALVASARERAQRLQDVTDQRIAQVHGRADRGIARGLATYQQQLAAISRQPSLGEAEQALLVRAVEALAEELVGQGDRPPC